MRRTIQDILGRNHVSFNGDFKQPKLMQSITVQQLCLGGYLCHGQLACQWGQIVGNHGDQCELAYGNASAPRTAPQHACYCVQLTKERFLLKIKWEKHPTVVHKRLSIATYTHTHTHKCMHTWTHTAGWEHISSPGSVHSIWITLHCLSRLVYLSRLL